SREGAAGLTAFGPELSRLRRAEGRSVAIQERYGQGDLDAVQQYMEELLTQKPHVIALSGAASMAAVMSRAGTTPVVFIGVGDPVAAGFIDSFEHPGGNMTGVFA